MNNKLKTFFKTKISVIDAQLDRYLPGLNTKPAALSKAIRYSVFNGGKRLRPILVLLGNNITGGKEKDAYPCAVAVELVHAYSLVHDDLPALDNDDLRRGKATTHKKFGEAAAILVGDALLTRAFEVISDTKDPKVLKKLLKILSSAAGVIGMVGGQFVDLESEGKGAKSEDAKNILNYIHANKTGALIRASLIMGAQSSNADTKSINALDNYGKYLGLIFQITDDILDIIGNKKKLGKRGSDADNQKLTYPALHGLEESKNMVKVLQKKADKALDIFPKIKAVLLRELLDYVANREC
ncbi:MAG: polyprenyl synthetase family protein [Elusimicrobiota bacterium]